MNARTIGFGILRVSLALLALFLCFRLGTGAMRFGLSRLFSTVAIVQAGVDSADRAVRVSPEDPEAHYTRALSLVNAERLEEAVAELQQAIRLRPHHYYQWLDLGVTLDRLGKQAEAAAALRQSIRLAPSFAQPHWQLGNLLYREGQYQDAFEELRLGAKSNPALFGGMLDLAWVASDGDIGRFEALAQPSDHRSRAYLAHYLVLQGKAADAVRNVQAAGTPANEEERSLRHQTISDLLARGNLSEAFDIWATAHPAASGFKGQLLNGDFLDPIAEDDPGFGWQLAKTSHVQAAIDPSGPAPNTRSLSFDFSGEISAGYGILNQFVQVAPNSHYSVSFFARTAKLMSGGPPVIYVIDANTQPPKVLGQSKPISAESSEWTSYAVDFTTAATTSGVLINLQRLPCSENTCPVFGRLWLSRFNLARN